MPKQKLHIVFVPGLDDGRYTLLKLLAWLWTRGSIRLHPYSARWRDGGDYEPKLEALLKYIDQLCGNGHKVALIGASAGASIVASAFMHRPQLVGVVNVSGRLYAGQNVTPSLRVAARTSPAFAESVRACESGLASLANQERSKFLILQPWRDPVVPFETMVLPGATIRRIAGLFHTDGIVLAMLFRRRTILKFLKSV